MKRYSLKKLKHLTYQSYKWYLKNKKEIPTEDLNRIEAAFRSLDQDFEKRDRESALDHYEMLDRFIGKYRKTPFWKYPLELAGALAFALIVATLIRQMVFEFYEIPSGSMRPTFREHDHLVVSKTTFGINIPLSLGHFYFDEKALPRGGIFIFSGEGVDLPDTDTKYFWLFPAKKRYIKRCMAKPFDSIYFYGGLLYGVDKEGNDITVYKNPLFTDELDHVPFNMFEGRAVRSSSGKKDQEIVYKQFNMPIGKLIYNSKGEVSGQVFNGKEWVKDQPSALKTPHQEIKTYSDYFGIVNFAMARLLNREEMGKLHPEVSLDAGVPLYLELAHTPRLAPVGSNKSPNSVLMTGQLAYETSLIPLSNKEISELMKNLYTARFTVTDSRARRFDAPVHQHDITLNNVPDGTYEFYDGVAYEIGWMGWSKKLPLNHPLYQFTPRIAQTLFNFGMELSNYYNPLSSYYAQFPSRYAYYRDGDFYVMGHLFLKKEDPLLVKFVESEKKRSIPFIDRGPPIKEGKIDADFIRTFGLTLKDKEYLALGDNYAMSADSRTFGPVREENLEGTPSFILWPPQERFGSPNVIAHPTFPISTVIVWSTVLLICIAVFFYDRKKKALPIFKEQLD